MLAVQVILFLVIGVASQKLPAPMGNPIWMEGCVRASAIDQLVLLDLVWLVAMSWCLPGRCGARTAVADPADSIERERDAEAASGT